jgi:hypothetical protein
MDDSDRELRSKIERKYGEERNVYRAVAMWQRIAVWSVAVNVVLIMLWACDLAK